MKKHSFLPVLCLILLAGCGKASTPPSNVQWKDLMKNPLYADRYWQELTDRMVNLILQDPTIKRDPQRFAIVDEVRRNALAKADEANLQERQGKMGSFIPANEDAIGRVLLLDHTLYFSSDFEVSPGPNLRIVLTTIIDPRVPGFPDNSSVDLRGLESPYGAQQYDISPAVNLAGIRTVALYDSRLKRLYGFAQLQ